VATYLRLIRELPESRRDVVARVREQLRTEGGREVPSSDLADALLLDGRHLRRL
jgi:hypothetical protein